MSSDLLPESVNSFLDDFETSLCLPILVVMVLCTVQFVFNHIVEIGHMIYQSIRRATPKKEPQNRKPINMTGKLKGILTTLGYGKPPGNADSPPMRNQLSSIIGTQSQEEEWDY